MSDQTLILLAKSDNNNTIAKMAEEKSYYDVAVSRFYYSTYQKVLWILYNRVPKYLTNQNLGEGSHNDAIRELKAYVYRKHKNQFTGKDFADLGEFSNNLADIKRYRVQADYDQRHVTIDEYNDRFKVKLYSVNNIINKVMSS